MLRNKNVKAGYNIFHSADDNVERCLDDLQRQVREAEESFTVDVKGFFCKENLDTHGMIHAAQVCVLSPKAKKGEVAAPLKKKAVK